MQVTLLGTGTSGGVPVLTCKCPVCTSSDIRNNRLRVSVHVFVENKSFVIDTGPDFRQQMLREKIEQLDAVFFTHEHKDHTAGLDDVRPFNYFQGLKDLPIYARPSVLKQLKREFQYAFEEVKYPGVPLLTTYSIENEPFIVQEIKVIPIEGLHHQLPVFGFRIKDFTYITDVSFIADEEIQKAEGSRILVLDALQQTPHVSHFTLSQAIEVARRIGAERTYFTHISHKMGLHEEIEKTLPKSMFLAYDGLKFEL